MQAYGQICKQEDNLLLCAVPVSEFCLRLSFGAGYRVCLGWQFA
jgi:hypothetical protein